MCLPREAQRVFGMCRVLMTRFFSAPRGSLLHHSLRQGTGGMLGLHKHLEAGAVGVGCQGGSAVIIMPGSAEAAAAPTLKPFGKAQYMGEASYWLPHDALWVTLNWYVMVAAAVFNRSKMVVCW